MCKKAAAGGRPIFCKIYIKNVFLKGEPHQVAEQQKNKKLIRNELLPERYGKGPYFDNPPLTDYFYKLICLDDHNLAKDGLNLAKGDLLDLGRPIFVFHVFSEVDFLGICIF